MFQSRLPEVPASRTNSMDIVYFAKSRVWLRLYTGHVYRPPTLTVLAISAIIRSLIGTNHYTQSISHVIESQLVLQVFHTGVMPMEVACPGLTMMPLSSGKGIWFCGRITTTAPAVSPAAETYSSCWIFSVRLKPVVKTVWDSRAVS